LTNSPNLKLVIAGKITPIISGVLTASRITYGETLSSSTLSVSGVIPSVVGNFAFTVPSTKPNAGTDSQSVTFTPIDTTNYNPVYLNVNVVVQQADATVSWPTAGVIIYGDALSAVTLTGAAGDGTFAFTNRDFIPEAGPTQSFEMTFTPNDAANYKTPTRQVVVTVNQADPSVNWPSATAILAGQTLASSAFSGGSATGVGGASLVGSFAWSNGSITPSTTGSYQVTFTPSSSNYKTATQNVIVTVNPTGPTFGSKFPSLNPTNVGADGLTYLMKYALGGTNTNDSVNLPTVALNGSTLSLTAVVRTNDTNVKVVGQWVTELGKTWSNVPTNPYGTESTNTNGVPIGCQRRDFSIPKDTNSRLFMRLQATQTN
jgi:hypothetical protein